jgi:hypothetical protein
MVKEIVCTGGQIALCDDEDYPVLSRFTWQYTGPPDNEYVRAWGNENPDTKGKTGHYMHKVVFGGKSPDHINRNRLDNRKENLRAATSQENGWNKGKNKATSGGRPCSSKYKGVCRFKDDPYWTVSITTTKKGVKPAQYLRIGGFKTELEAAKRYNIEIVKLRGKWAWVNPLPEEINQQV